jgi:hypothetical protein
MKLLFIFGSLAVGKMTVGQELMKITDLRLFHNHMSIDFVSEIFGEFNWDVVCKVRELVFEEFANSDNYGLIFTYSMGFNVQSEWDNVNLISEIFKRVNAEIYYVELVAPQEIRLQRNSSENRLQHKPSKRNIEKSNQGLIDWDIKYRCVSEEGEISFENYIKIENTDLSAEVVAKMIKERFSL